MSSVKTGTVGPLAFEKSKEKLSGVVERVTYHNPQNGWTVLKVKSFQHKGELVPVVVHHSQIFPGSTMDFFGVWNDHPKHGVQFVSHQCIEKKPATAAALEKYLSSGLIKGVGPVIASRIVKYFGPRTLEVFENDLEALLKVPGIADSKLEQIKSSWQNHKAIRDVMIFLQGFGISTLYSTKIYKTYGDESIAIVSKNPYQLAKDVEGIGFFSADKIAINMGFEKDGAPRIQSALKTVLDGAREQGHCFLKREQILEQAQLLLEIENTDLILNNLEDLVVLGEIKKEILKTSPIYYSKSLYYDEKFVAQKVYELSIMKKHTQGLYIKWKKTLEDHSIRDKQKLSTEQENAVLNIMGSSFSILTGGPGCGKTTTTRRLVQLLLSFKKKVVLAAPTGRAAQRMMEVIGVEAKTVHRLLEWQPLLGKFKKNESDPIDGDFIIVDETSMLDINLTARLLRAVSMNTQVLFIGDPDQLPSVGAGQVLLDLIGSRCVNVQKLTKIFRQAEESLIIKYAHEINQGKIPYIDTPIKKPWLLKPSSTCIFVDSDEATQEQMKFLARAKYMVKKTIQEGTSFVVEKDEGDLWELQKKADEKIYLENIANKEELLSGKEPVFRIPEKFHHVDWGKLALTSSITEELIAVLKKVSPYSTLHYGMTTGETLARFYSQTIPKVFGNKTEIQVLSPQVRGSVGTIQLNKELQALINPPDQLKKETHTSDRLLREGDRVIQTRNNYDLNVFNGDIGIIKEIDNEDQKCFVEYEHHGIVEYSFLDLQDLALAYCITVHKSQGSEFEVVIIPLATQHSRMLYRNLIYTALTRAKKLCVFIGSRRAFAFAIKTLSSEKRQTLLKERLQLMHSLKVE